MSRQGAGLRLTERSCYANSVPLGLYDMSPEIIDKAFATIRGLPCWHVEQGYGSFLTLQFGAPHQEIGEIRPRRTDDPRSHARRPVHIRGDAHLSLYCCGWRIAQDGNVLVCNESTRESILTGCRALEGQAFSEFSFRPDSGHSRFMFDLGGKISTGPYDDEVLEQWMLFLPDGYVLTYRSDGAFSYGPSDSTDKPFEQVTKA